MRDIFEKEHYRGTGVPMVSAVMVTTVVLSAISLLATVLVIAHFGELTARIAIWMAGFLSSGMVLLLWIVVIIYLVVRLRWRRRRRFWDW